MSTNPVTAVSAADLRQLLDENACILIDVREADEFASAHIAGAQLFPLSSFQDACLPSDDEKIFVFTCAVGRRSLMAAQYAAQEKSIRSASLEGGIKAWMEAGFPVETD